MSFIIYTQTDKLVRLSRSWGQREGHSASQRDHEPTIISPPTGVENGVANCTLQATVSSQLRLSASK